MVAFEGVSCLFFFGVALRGFALVWFVLSGLGWDERANVWVVGT